MAYLTWPRSMSFLERLFHGKGSLAVAEIVEKKELKPFLERKNKTNDRYFSLLKGGGIWLC